MKREAYAVIGSNYGDEGKGLMTDKFCEKLIEDGHKEVLNIRFNGGIQAGHTVVRGNNRHVFNIIGSGSLLNKKGDIKVHTYYAKECILNTVIDEYNAFEKEGGVLGSIYANSECRLTTIYDIKINRAREEKRDKERHGSCGMGIFETIKRDRVVAFRVKDLYNGKEHVEEILKKIRDFYIEEAAKSELKLNEDDLTEEFITKETNNILNYFKARLIRIDNESSLLNGFSGLVFEGAQGLLLDMDRMEYFPHLTPSNTGMKNVVECVNNCELEDLHVCYVTRSYDTRHGAGPMICEVEKDDLGPDVEDKTNVFNDYQRNFRYGRLDFDFVLRNIRRDFEFCNNIKVNTNVFIEIAITHLDQTNGYLRCVGNDLNVRKLNKLSDFDKVYISYGEKARNINDMEVSE